MAVGVAEGVEVGLAVGVVVGVAVGVEVGLAVGVNVGTYVRGMQNGGTIGMRVGSPDEDGPQIGQLWELVS